MPQVKIKTYYRYGTIYREVFHTQFEWCALMDGGSNDIAGKALVAILKNSAPQLFKPCPFPTVGKTFQYCADYKKFAAGSLREHEHFLWRQKLAIAASVWVLQIVNDFRKHLDHPIRQWNIFWYQNVVRLICNWGCGWFVEKYTYLQTSMFWIYELIWINGCWHRNWRNFEKYQTANHRSSIWFKLEVREKILFLLLAYLYCRCVSSDPLLEVVLSKGSLLSGCLRTDVNDNNLCLKIKIYVKWCRTESLFSRQSTFTYAEWRSGNKHSLSCCLIEWLNQGSDCYLQKNYVLCRLVCSFPGISACTSLLMIMNYVQTGGMNNC